MPTRPEITAGPPPDDPPPGRSEPGAGQPIPRQPSARALLLTVLGEFVLPAGGEVWTGTLVDSLSLLGIAPKTSRQAVARSAEAGWLVPAKRGRRTRWHLTDSARRLLEEGTERIYGFGTSTPEWDGRWTLLLTSVPEASRHLRYRLRTRLGWVGFAPIGPGDWISPWPQRAAEAWAVLDELGLAGATRSFTGQLGTGDQGQAPDAPGLAAEAWSLKELGADYDEFIAVHSQARPDSPEEMFVALSRLVHHWRSFPGRDPDLPAELLPEPWSGHQAALTFHELHRRWSPGARRWWLARESEEGAATSSTATSGAGTSGAGTSGAGTSSSTNQLHDGE